MKLIAAADSRYGIGKNGTLLFSLKRDMKFFRETTTDHVVVMGRKTLDSFPNGKPLKNRINIVLTRDDNFSRDGVTVCLTVKDVFDAIDASGREDVFVIGGAQIYKLFLPYCSEALITEVDADGGADVFLNDFRSDNGWTLVKKSKPMVENGIEFCFTTYKNNNVRDFNE